MNRRKLITHQTPRTLLTLLNQGMLRARNLLKTHTLHQRPRKTSTKTPRRQTNRLKRSCARIHTDKRARGQLHPLKLTNRNTTI